MENGYNSKLSEMWQIMVTFIAVLTAAEKIAAIKAPHTWETIHTSGSKELKPELISNLKNIAGKKTILPSKEKSTTYSYRRPLLA